MATRISVLNHGPNLVGARELAADGLPIKVIGIIPPKAFKELDVQDVARLELFEIAHPKPAQEGASDATDG